MAPGAASASECFHLAGRSMPARVMPASLALEEAQVGIRYLGHASFLIQSDEGLRIVTDWAGDLAWKLDTLPDVVTMNHAHETHWTAFPDPEIDHALEGWGDGVDPAHHFLRLGETLIRNVPTDIRSYGGEAFGNSIFIFEHKGLCIGHLGHLHHEPTEDQYAMIGRLDVVMAPVDGGMTLDIESMVRVLKRLKAKIVLPMHAFGPWTLERFLKGMEEDFAVVQDDDDDVLLSLKTLPKKATVLVPASL